MKKTVRFICGVLFAAISTALAVSADVAPVEPPDRFTVTPEGITVITAVLAIAIIVLGGILIFRRKGSENIPEEKELLAKPAATPEERKDEENEKDG